MPVLSLHCFLELNLRLEALRVRDPSPVIFSVSSMYTDVIILSSLTIGMHGGGGTKTHSKKCRFCLPSQPGWTRSWTMEAPNQARVAGGGATARCHFTRLGTISCPSHEGAGRGFPPLLCATAAEALVRFGVCSPPALLTIHGAATAPNSQGAWCRGGDGGGSGTWGLDAVVAEGSREAPAE